MPTLTPKQTAARRKFVDAISAAAGATFDSKVALSAAQLDDDVETAAEDGLDRETIERVLKAAAGSLDDKSLADLRMTLEKLIDVHDDPTGIEKLAAMDARRQRLALDSMSPAARAAASSALLRHHAKYAGSFADRFGAHAASIKVA